MSDCLFSTPFNLCHTMAVPLSLPGRSHFYPIGSRSALCLTRDLPPEPQVAILLLPCGGPTSVLYTVYSEASASKFSRFALNVRDTDYSSSITRIKLTGRLTLRVAITTRG